LEPFRDIKAWEDDLVCPGLPKGGLKVKFTIRTFLERLEGDEFLIFIEDR